MRRTRTGTSSAVAREYRAARVLRARSEVDRRYAVPDGKEESAATPRSIRAFASVTLAPASSMAGRMPHARNGVALGESK